MKTPCAVVICLVVSAATLSRAQDPPRLVKGLAVLMQAMRAIEEFVAIGELSSIHNEDVSLAGAVEVLRAETKLASPAAQQDVTRTLIAFGQPMGDLHQAADAFKAAEAKARLAQVLETFAALKRFYGREALAAAQKLADVYACPMHRDVVGKRTQACPKCGMALDYAVKVPLWFFGQPEYNTVRARIQLESPIQAGRELNGTLQLRQYSGEPVLITDLRVVHTERIHLLIIDPSLIDYHHVHPQPTTVPGAYAFRFTPVQPGPYRAWADLRTTYGGFQEFAAADIQASKTAAVVDRTVKLDAGVDKLQYALLLDKPTLTAGEPVRARLRVTDLESRPFARLEPVMGTFAHLVAFHENWKTVLHIHPSGTKALLPTDRGGPELAFQFYAAEPGFYCLFAQVQIGGVSKFARFGVNVVPRRASTTTD